MGNTTNIVNVSGDCFDHIDISLDGFWNEKHGESILQHSLFRFHVQILVMFYVANSFHFMLKRFHFSRFTSEILTGIALGPNIMGKWFHSSSGLLFPTVVPNQLFASLSKIGYIFFTFLIGVRMDPGLIWKMGRKAFFLACILYICSFVMILTHEVDYPGDSPLAAGTELNSKLVAHTFFAAIIQTEFFGVSLILMQLKIINSQMGHLALATSLLTQLLRHFMGTVTGFIHAIVDISPNDGTQAIAASLAFFVLIVGVLRKAMFTFIRRTPEGKPVNGIYATIIGAMVLCLAIFCGNFGMYFTFGPLICGLAVPAGSPLAESIMAKFNMMISGFLLPLLSIFCASKIDLGQFFMAFDVALNFKISAIGFMIKLAATFLAARYVSKVPLKDAAALTIVLNAKGVQEVGFFLSYGELLDMQVGGEIFLVFLLQAFQPLLIKKFYNPAKKYIGYTKKSIEHASDDAPLHILACAHRLEDAVAAIKLLRYSKPTKESPLSIFGLCLQELFSSATPLLINHQLGQKSSSAKGCHIQPIMDIFKYLKSQCDKFVQVNLFTAISPLKQMHEDICWLSFDKACSLIILPFHKKWDSKGKMVSSNTHLRNLNIDVLERAPCSVGILIDRSPTLGLSSIFNTSTTYRVAVVFVGGQDDREALAFASRIAGSAGVHITVLRFIPENNDYANRWDMILDSEIFRNLRPEISGRTNISFVEETVKEGADTSRIIKSMVGDYDLIMVGRRHDTEMGALSGLSEWTDLPELGPLGDLLASEDISAPISVLVVQQQILIASHSSTLNQ